MRFGACKRKQELIEAIYRRAMEGDAKAAVAFLFHDANEDAMEANEDAMEADEDEDEPEQ